MAEPTYTVFVRVPIPRGDFVDPPPVRNSLNPVTLKAIMRAHPSSHGEANLKHDR
jgi:hypothetical protein